MILIKKSFEVLHRVLNCIVCGDAISVMERLPAGCIDLIITSPPYNLKNSTGGGFSNGSGGKWENACLLGGYASYRDNMPYNDYVVWQRACLTEMFRLLTNTGAIFYNHKWRVQDGLLQDRSDIVKGFPVRQIIIWKRKGGINFNSGYFLPTYEVIYLITKPKFRLAKKMNACGDVWEFTQERNNPHPAPFPLLLAERMVTSARAKIVLDPFMGSGTTLAAAKKFNISYIGIEKSFKYCERASKRTDSLIIPMFNQLKLF